MGLGTRKVRPQGQEIEKFNFDMYLYDFVPEVSGSQLLSNTFDIFINKS